MAVAAHAGCDAPPHPELWMDGTASPASARSPTACSPWCHSHSYLAVPRHQHKYLCIGPWNGAGGLTQLQTFLGLLLLFLLAAGPEGSRR